MYEKNDFINKYVKAHGIDSITVCDVNNAVIDAYNKYDGDLNVITLKIHNRYHIDVDSNLQTRIKEILIEQHKFDKSDILSVHKIDSDTIGVSLHLYKE